MPRGQPLDLSTGTKHCPRCETVKPLSEFYKSKSTTHGYQVYCKTCCAVHHDGWRRKNLAKTREASRKWREENPDLAKDHKRKSVYGLSLGEYEALLHKQNGRCAICSSPTAGGRGGFHVDHCHNTKRIRGLLCHRCNLGIGQLNHDPSVLEAAIRYLAEAG